MGGFLGSDANRMAALGGGLALGQGLFGNNSPQQFNAEIAGLDKDMLSQTQGDIQGLRDLATTDVTGVSQSGLAAQGLAKGLFDQEQDRLGRQLGGQKASAMSNASRFGMDSGGAERMATSLGNQGMVGAQQLNQANATNMADIASRDIAGQESRKFTALSALPQLSSGLMNSQFNADMQAANITNQQNAVNQANQAEADSQKSNLFGTIGGIAGGIFGGGPLGGAAGSTLGNIVGGLF